MNTPLRGRERELAAVADLIAAAQRGESSFLLVGGRAGFGTTRFLRAAVELARAAGLRVGFGGAEDGGQAVPMMTLLSVLFSGPQPLLERAALRELPSAPEQRFWLVQELAALLEAAALSGPLLVCVDDLQWADPGTLAALRSLAEQLADLPIVWIAAYRAESAAADVLEQFAALGPRRLTLGRLEEEAALQVAADILGADPDPRLLRLVTSTDGNPFLLVELLSGLLGEGRVYVDGAMARLSGAGLPARLRKSMRARLDQLSAPARELAYVAAVLGRRFTYDQLTAMLGGGSTTALLRPIEELLQAGILVEVGQQLALGHDLVREAVLDATPASSRRALQRRAVDVFLADGALPVEVARQLADSAQPGDRPAVSLLSRAAEALAMSDAALAAELAVKAMELADPHDVNRGQLTARAAVQLLLAGRTSEGQALAEGALAALLPPQQRAEVSLTIAEMNSIPANIRARICQSALELPDLPDLLRLRLRTRLAYSLVHSGDPAQGRQVLDAISRDNPEIEDQSSWWAVQIAEQALEMLDDRFGEALDRAVRLRQTSGAGKPSLALAPGSAHTHYVYVETLSLRDDFDKALRVIESVVASAERNNQVWFAGTFERQRGRLWAAAGRLDDAAAALERVSGLAPSEVPHAGDAAAVAALGRVALHTRNHQLLERCARIAEQTMEAVAPEPRRHLSWLLAMQAMAEGDSDAARAVLTRRRDPTLLPTYFTDPADPVQLVRIALACGDRRLADEAVRIAERRHERNPGVASLQAIAAHTRGLRDGDVAEIARAVRYFEPSPRLLARASAVEDHGRLLVGEGRKAEGIAELGEALKLYAGMGATWDATRTRARLRRLGVRRNLQPARPVDDWAGVTDSEISVVRLVAEGKTNREVAARLYLSPYTVNVHLRHVFTKLGIRSRVDLIRLFVAHQDAL